jgi:hypothetical protein
MTQGDTVHIRITGRGGADHKKGSEDEEDDSEGETALEARMRQRRKDNKNKRQTLQPIEEIVRDNSNTVPAEQHGTQETDKDAGKRPQQRKTT